MPALTSVIGTPSWLTCPTFKRTIAAMPRVEWQNSKENEPEDVSLATTCNRTVLPSAKHYSIMFQIKKKYTLKSIPPEWGALPGRDSNLCLANNESTHLGGKTTVATQGKEQEQRLRENINLKRRPKNIKKLNCTIVKRKWVLTTLLSPPYWPFSLQL